MGLVRNKGERAYYVWYMHLCMIEVGHVALYYILRVFESVIEVVF
jgi:hypothetical protein